MSSNIIGQVLLNQFRVDAFVASGGMGAVFRVWDLHRNVPLAMKVLHSELADDPSMFKRFKREATALKKLAHPNIVPFYGLYQTDQFDFMLERFIDGPTLKDIIKQRQGKPLPIGEALVYLKALCAALGYAHANGVVHCDVKPGNVMVDRGGSVYLTDFGIARHSESTTTTMGTAGTPAYMAPEQIRGESVSPATDVYALGIVLFEMLTGQRPFRGTEAGTEKGGITVNERICYGHLTIKPPDPHSINPDLSEGLASAVLKALAKNPQERYASTQEFFNAVCLQSGRTVGEVAERVRLPAVFAQEDTVKGQDVIPGNQPIVQPVLATKRRMTWLGTGGAVLGVLILIGGIVLYTRQLRPVPTIVPVLPTHVAVIQVPTDTQELISTQPPAITQPPNTLPTDPPIPTDTPVPLPEPQTTKTNPKDGMVMVYVPGGNFTMGDTVQHAQSLCVPYPTDCNTITFTDEAPPHTVNLNAYWIDKTEVSNAIYGLCVQAGQCASNDGGSDNKPAVNVSWYNAQNYCQWAGERLPTEAEWEKAARGTDGRIFPWGDSAPTCSRANYSQNGNGACSAGAVFVDSNQDGASPYGAVNMVGNVWEWVYDWFADYSSS